MPTSHHEVISPVFNLVTRISPASVLDIGVGFGKNGMLCREYLDVWRGRYPETEEWKTRIDGIEIFPKYRNPIWEFCYDNIIIGNIMDHLDILGDYNLVLLIDVIEHLSKDDGMKILETITGSYIVSTPRNLYRTEEGAFGNEHERHVSLWYPSEFEQSLELSRQLVGWKIV